MNITVILRNSSPYHSSAPGEARVTIDGRFAAEGFPCVRTRSMAYLGADPTGDEARTPRFAPVVPANSARHMLRAALLDHVFEQWRGRHTLSTGAYAAACSGNASGNPDGLPPSFAECAAVRAHPFLGLFGGGPRMIEGRLRVDAAWPITADTLALLGGGWESYATTGRITAVEWKRRVDPVQTADESAAELIDGGATAITAWSTAANGDDAARGLRALNAHEVVIPGVTWLWRIGVMRPTDAQIGMLVHGLDGLRGRVWGGGGALGYGRMEVVRAVFGSIEVLRDGQIVDGPEVAQWLDAVPELEPAEFEAFAATRKAPKEEKEKKK